MPTKILLIENDSAFASQLSESLEASGFDVRVGPEGKTGLELAREWGPSAIVLCVELPGMSGYLVCQKLRKDDSTKAIPLVLTSAEASADTFEKHKALKVRADEYLLKPFVPQALLDKLASLGLAAPAPTKDEPMADGPSDLPAFDLESLPDEPASSGEPAELSLDDDLAFLDEAFEGISTPDETKTASEAPVAEGDLAADSLPAEDESAAHADLAGLDFEGEDPLAGLEETVAPLASDALQAAALELTAEAPAEDEPVRGASADALRAAGIPLAGEIRPDRPTPPPAPAPPHVAPPAPSPRPTLSGLPIPGSLRSAIIPPPPAPAPFSAAAPARAEKASPRGEPASRPRATRAGRGPLPGRRPRDGGEAAARPRRGGRPARRGRRGRRRRKRGRAGFRARQARDHHRPGPQDRSGAQGGPRGGAARGGRD